MKKASLFLLAISTALGQVSDSPREKLSLDRGWLFHLGDVPFPVVTGHQTSYLNAKAGSTTGAAAPIYDDTDWLELDLPHDWASEAPFDPKANIAQGYRPRGIGWYRRYLQIDPADRGKHLELQFDGVSTHCTVWINGTLVHRNWCGYTSFTIDLTPLARYGNEFNTIAIRVDADAQEGWWYEGAGIYRHTWLTKRSPAHIATEGVFAQPVRAPRKPLFPWQSEWSIPIQVILQNSGQQPEKVQVETSLLDTEGRILEKVSIDCEIPPLNDTIANLAMFPKNPKLWSVDSPNLYQIHTVLRQAGKIIDEDSHFCGFRTFRFDADTGFYLNDQPLKIQGVCNHQDHAGIGVAMPDSMWDFRLRLLKEMGVNAVRCSHHPPAAEFLDACDRLGMLVMDEARNFNISPEYIGQLEWMIRRDRNHPSVFLWSVFNEEPFQGTEEGYEMTRRMAAAVKRLDTTRPVTAAMSGGFFNPINVSAAVDVMGFNYHQKDYDAFHQQHPTLPILSSEDTSCFITRGEFRNDKEKQTADSGDTYAARWGATHRDGWKAIATRPFIAGGFVWTGFDYHGEPTPFEWPCTSSSFGILDLCGFPKSAFYIHQAQWRKDIPVLELIPHWNWPEMENKPIRVMALSNAEKVELYLNGRSVGEKAVDPFEMVEWQVPYEPGFLEAVGKKNGKEVSRKKVETTGSPVTLELIPDRPQISGNGQDALPITVRALDEKRRPVPTAMLPVTFSLDGPANIIGLGNGDPRCHEPEKGNQRSLFNGLAQVILQSQAGGSGHVTLRAESKGIQSAELKIPVTSAPEKPFFPKARFGQRIDRWKASPGFSVKPDPLLVVPDNDMNSWSSVTPGKTISLTQGSWSIFSAKVEPFAPQRKNGGVIRFQGINGKAEVWIDGKLSATKSDYSTAPLTAPFPSGTQKRSIRVLIEAEKGKPIGFTAPVLVESTSTQEANAQGELAGEVTDHSALLQSRITSIPGPLLDSRGDIPGMEGRAYFEWSANESFQPSQRTSLLEAKAESDFIIRASIEGLREGTRYFYRLVFENGNKGPTRTFQTRSPRGDHLSFCMGNCMNYYSFITGQPNGDGPVTATVEDKQLGYPSFAAMQKLNPDFFIGAGDIVYYDFPKDSPAQTVPQLRKKWHEQFRFPRLISFFGGCGTYWMKDDHDFRFDDADLSGNQLPSVKTGRNLFREQMPICPIGDTESPNYRTHRISRDLQIWFLEGRDYRSDNKSPTDSKKSIWGEAQRKWLEASLQSSPAKWKIIVSPTPLVGPDRANKSDNHTNLNGFRDEADSFFQWLTDKKIQNVLILCGDRHWQYHSIHPSGVEELCCGALNDENSIRGIAPGDPTSTDPQATIRQPYLYPNPTGGFLHVDLSPNSKGTSPLIFSFYDDGGKLLHQVIKETP
jgi:beta-galactosidase